MVPKVFWLRCETKKLERRSALTPSTAGQLIKDGFTVFVERDQQRIFDDEEFERVGCSLVDNNTWPSASLDIPVIGLKELATSDEPLPHTHIYFGHCYKGQAGWSSVLSRFKRGGGTLYDLESFTDATGRRVAAFGFHAGFAGAAVGALALASQREGRRLANLEPYASEVAMVANVRAAFGGSGKGAKALVIGALGRCGCGAVDFLRKIGLDEGDILKWDVGETVKGGPFEELLHVDIFINCISLSSAIPPFLTRDQLEAAGAHRRLSVVVDVSCDATNPFNPLPIYDVITTFPEPTVPVDLPQGPPLSVVSIDHLPSLLPREASEQFSSDLLLTLKEFPRRDTARVWTDAKKMFDDKMAEAAAELASKS